MSFDGEAGRAHFISVHARPDVWIEVGLHRGRKAHRRPELLLGTIFYANCHSPLLLLLLLLYRGNGCLSGASINRMQRVGKPGTASLPAPHGGMQFHNVGTPSRYSFTFEVCVHITQIIRLHFSVFYFLQPPPRFACRKVPSCFFFLFGLRFILSLEHSSVVTGSGTGVRARARARMNQTNPSRNGASARPSPTVPRCKMLLRIFELPRE